TVGYYVDQLIGHGYLRETGLEQSGMGRPKRSLGARPEAGWFAGVEFNAERIQAAGVDFSGKLMASELRLLSEGANTAAIMDEVKSAIRALRHDVPTALLGLGIGVPGVVDPALGLGLDYAFVADWQKVPVARTLRSAFRVDVALENNLRVIALA